MPPWGPAAAPAASARAGSNINATCTPFRAERFRKDKEDGRGGGGEEEEEAVDEEKEEKETPLLFPRIPAHLVRS